ncbi:serine hydrolase domain-containing protein [Actinoallomurus sp. CA-142502]|uniref:serine hydrolase domain-containing protein n=1 Tax=Actinoallomurus sp. CA-142502 TaxID=3239885 RepID=UPI003D8BA97A
MKFWRAGTRAVIALSILITGAAGVTAARAEAQTPGEVLQAGVTKARSDNNLPGVIGMVRDGETVEYAHAGWGDMFMRVPADPKAQFRIGSNTKQFTSTVLLQLEAEHKLSLDDTVDRWLPGVVNKNGNDGKKITIRQLLNHTSRLPDYISDTAFRNEYIADLNNGKHWDPRKLVDIAISNPPLDKFAYSNTNYILAGMVIKAVTGNDPATEVKNRIIDPLGLKNTTFPTDDPKLYGNWLHGYEWVRDISFSNVSAFGPAGAIVSTMDDLADFDRALFSGRLLPPAQQQELETVGGFTNYALGVGRVDTKKCGEVFTHTGEVLGYVSTWISSADGERQVVVAQNEYHVGLVTDNEPGVTAQWDTAVDAYCATGR